jgi:hypothetical protein
MPAGAAVVEVESNGRLQWISRPPDAAVVALRALIDPRGTPDGQVKVWTRRLGQGRKKRACAGAKAGNRRGGCRAGDELPSSGRHGEF